MKFSTTLLLSVLVGQAIAGRGGGRGGGRGSSGSRGSSNGHASGGRVASSSKSVSVYKARSTSVVVNNFHAYNPPVLFVGVSPIGYQYYHYSPAYHTHRDVCVGYVTKELVGELPQPVARNETLVDLLSLLVGNETDAAPATRLRVGSKVVWKCMGGQSCDGMGCKSAVWTDDKQLGVIIITFITLCLGLSLLVCVGWYAVVCCSQLGIYCCTYRYAHRVDTGW